MKRPEDVDVSSRASERRSADSSLGGGGFDIKLSFSSELLCSLNRKRCGAREKDPPPKEHIQRRGSVHSAEQEITRGSRVQTHSSGTWTWNQMKGGHMNAY